MSPQPTRALLSLLCATSLASTGCDEQNPGADANAGSERAPTTAQTQDTKDGAPKPDEDTPPGNGLEDSLKAQADDARKGKKQSWSVTYTGDLTGSAKGESVVIGDMGAMVSVGLNPTLSATQTGVIISVMDGQKRQEEGYKSKMNRIMLKKEAAQGYECVATQGSVTFTKFNDKNKLKAGTFEAKMSCTKPEDPTDYKKIDVTGEFSS